MFVSLSRTLRKFGGARLGLGIRITAKNALWMSLIVLFVCMFQLAWYMVLLCFWLVYAVCYGLLWCIKKPFTRKKVRD